ncbi:BglG family transcription antiterminator [Virgibacillus siamensis]|uniref:BglG family transcription antiterminator n=1 Tax=Virgibacillus siamensis TaxID=480071 RepID=UPI0009842729|nr:BglG family transcription antiterminator [Virgibacillus siamensis]
MYISGRARKIIQLLLDADEALLVNQIAKTLDVSERTVHRNLKSVEEMVAGYGLQLDRQSGVGLQLSGDSEAKHELEKEVSNTAFSDFTAEERQAIIFSTLLEMDEPIKLFTLANELKVTIATVSNDLDLLENELHTYNLSLVRKRGYGVRMEGNESNKRAALSSLIASHMDPFKYVALLKKNIKKQQQTNTISNRLLGLVDPEKLTIIEKTVNAAMDELPQKLADSAYIGLVVHLALALERLLKGDSIHMDPDYLAQMEESREFAVARKMIRHFEEAFQMDIPKDEIGYITMHLMGAKIRSNQNSLMEESGLDIVYKAKELITYISSMVQDDLRENTVLLNDLAAHLKPSIYRMKQGLVIRNPLIEEIKRDYASLFDLIQEAVEEIFPELDFPDDEIGYLVLHFAAAMIRDEAGTGIRALVICSSGIGTAKILATKLKQHVPEIKHVENKSVLDLDQQELGKYDVVVSTIGLEGFQDEYIQISPMLTNAEVHRIKKAIKQRKITRRLSHDAKPLQQNDDFMQQLKRTQHYTKAVADLLNSVYVANIQEKLPTASVLQVIGNALETHDLIRNRELVIQKLQKREQKGGLGIPDTTLALYHARSSGLDSLSFSIYPLGHPLTLEGMDNSPMKADTILVMLAPDDANQETLDVLSHLSSLIIQDEESMRLFESGDEEQVMAFMSREMQKFLYDKNIL